MTRSVGRGMQGGIGLSFWIGADGVTRIQQAADRLGQIVHIEVAGLELAHHFRLNQRGVIDWRLGAVPHRCVMFDTHNEVRFAVTRCLVKLFEYYIRRTTENCPLRERATATAAPGTFR